MVQYAFKGWQDGGTNVITTFDAGTLAVNLTAVYGEGVMRAGFPWYVIPIGIVVVVGYAALSGGKKPKKKRRRR